MISDPNPNHPNGTHPKISRCVVYILCTYQCKSRAGGGGGGVRARGGDLMPETIPMSGF